MISRAVFISVLMVITAIGSGVVVPVRQIDISAPDLGAVVPEAFGEWTPLKIADAVLPPEAELGPGEAVLYRAWSDQAGRVVTLVVAYGPPLGDSVRLHRPETCYRSQGYTIIKRSLSSLLLTDGSTIQTVSLDTQQALRPEAVTYWMRDGDTYIENAHDHQLLFFQRGLSAVADGALIRVSSHGEGQAGDFLFHAKFLRDFVDALPAEGRSLFLASDE